VSANTVLPSGDGLAPEANPNGNCLASEDCFSEDATEHHYTGKVRDSESGNDYFGARYYASSTGRFMSPDPVGDWAASIDDPQSWNQYAYVEGNPLKMVDPNGTCGEISAGIGMSPSNSQDLLNLATEYGFNVAFPYAGEDKADSVADIAAAGIGANAGATVTAAAALDATNADDGGTGKIFLGFSGGAQANISGGVDSSMGTVAFYDPGLGLGQDIPAGSSVFMGGKAISDLVNTASALSGTHTGKLVPGCGHDVACAIKSSASLRKLLQAAGPCNHPTVFVRNPLTFVPLMPIMSFSPISFSLPQCHTEQISNTIYDQDGNVMSSSSGPSHLVCD
jgi:RHS repeat-associated protein